MRTRLILGIIVVILLVILGVVFVNVVSNNVRLPFMSSQPKSSVSIDNHTFKVKVAKTQQEQEIGLSGTSSLPQDQGMLFTFDKADYYAFWMRNMKYPLDIIYIANKKIVSIANNVPSPTNPSAPLPVYKPSQPADTVLEINGGLSDKYGFKVGDSVSVSL